MNVENILEEFHEFVGQFVPESASYIVKKDAKANITQDMMKIYRHKEKQAIKRKKGDPLDKTEINKVLKLTLMKYANKYGYRSFIVQIKSEDYYSVFLRDVLSSVRGFDGKRILSIGSGICIPEIFAAKRIFTESLVICVDFSRESCKTGKMIAEKAGISSMEFVVADAENLPFKKGKIFSSVWLLGGLSFKKDLKYKKEIESMAIEKVVSM